MVSIFLVGVAAMMVGALMPMAAKTEKMVGNHQQAASIVQHKVDQLRGVGYGRLTAKDLKAAQIIDATSTTTPFPFGTVDTLSNYFPRPTGTIDIVDFNASTRKVTVTLTWAGSAYKQGNGTVTAIALIAKG
ncbi:MAG: hypothetical protein QOJ65_1794 [Fimbriimonadaceae bacterium]|jgi:hypothetical protein|nr:hypothetical protein [Fimbriimonadaceae bacterium]